MRAFLALGSNMGDRRRFLSDAVAGLPDVVGVSNLYETEPIGGPDQQESYLNCVVELDTDYTPRELLERCRRLEEKAGRQRREQWAPRTLDIDVLLVGDEKVNDPDLQVPHPRMWERRFVLAPLADLAPELVPDDWQQTTTGEVRRVKSLDMG